jgi:hypothetical protein
VGQLENFQRFQKVKRKSILQYRSADTDPTFHIDEDLRILPRIRLFDFDADLDQDPAPHQSNAYHICKYASLQTIQGTILSS